MPLFYLFINASDSLNLLGEVKKKEYVVLLQCVNKQQNWYTCPLVTFFGQRKLIEFYSLQSKYKMLEPSLKDDIYFQHPQAYQYMRSKMSLDIAAFE